jgi:hypothetical protein
MKRGNTSQYLVWIYSIVVGFTHFATIGSINEAVRENSNRKCDSCAHENTWPDHAVEPDDVLSDYMSKNINHINGVAFKIVTIQFERKKYVPAI